MIGEDGYVHRVLGAARIALADVEVGGRLDSLDEILSMDPGPNQYDTREWILDLGSSRSGITYSRDKVSFQLAEVHPTQITELLTWDPYSLIVMMQRNDKSIWAWVWYRVQTLPMELDVPWRGEATAALVEVAVLDRQDQGKILRWEPS